MKLQLSFSSGQMLRGMFLVESNFVRVAASPFCLISRDKYIFLGLTIFPSESSCDTSRLVSASLLSQIGNRNRGIQQLLRPRVPYLRFPSPPRLSYFPHTRLPEITHNITWRPHRLAGGLSPRWWQSFSSSSPSSSSLPRWNSTSLRIAVTRPRNTNDVYEIMSLRTSLWSLLRMWAGRRGMGRLLICMYVVGDIFIYLDTYTPNSPDGTLCIEWWDNGANCDLVCFLRYRSRTG